MIEGGTATNVVPERCRVEAEVRSLDDAQGDAPVRARWSTRSRGRRARTETDVDTDGRGAVPRLPHPASPTRRGGRPRRRCATAASSRCHASTGGGSDASAFAGQGLPLPEPRQRHRGATTRPTSASARRRWRRCSTWRCGCVERAAGRDRDAEAAARPRRLGRVGRRAGRAADGRARGRRSDARRDRVPGA